NPQTGDEKGMTVLFAGVVIALSCLWIVGTFNRRKEA
ncbi:MAG: LPXTG cell wall anchor domain-containing protein, partial [Oscillospiraceae bacterium]|nr:LPXTG cell wall anchor domain-containing protein [Oscillospiraceae bacterium]